MNDVYTISGDEILLKVKVVPGASKTAVAGVNGGRLKITVAAAPEDGKANAALCAFLAKEAGCAKKEVRVVSGEKSRLKTVALPEACEEKIKTLVN